MLEAPYVGFLFRCYSNPNPLLVCHGSQFLIGRLGHQNRPGGGRFGFGSELASHKMLLNVCRRKVIIQRRSAPCQRGGG